MYIRQCFCAHKFTVIKRVILYEDDFAKRPCGEKIVMCCDKCGFIKSKRI